MIHSSNYLSLRKTPKAIESTSQKTSSQNSSSKCSAGHANGAKSVIIIPQNYFGYSSLRKTPKAIENTSQKASSSQNSSSKCMRPSHSPSTSANHAVNQPGQQKQKIAPILSQQNSYLGIIPINNMSLHINSGRGRGGAIPGGAVNYESKSVISYVPSIEIVSSKDRNGCMVACIAMIANRSYGEIREMVGNRLGPRGGLLTSDAQAVLVDLGFSVTQCPQDDSWDGFPNLAIIGVHGPNARPHGVVFQRKNGIAKIYDCNRFGPVPPIMYRLIVPDVYLSIDGRINNIPQTGRSCAFQAQIRSSKKLTSGRGHAC
jgi:hypothetical protein